jgi:hypothetical protein
MALALALDSCVDEHTFAEPDPNCVCPQAIRIVEKYLTRKVGALVAGDPGAADGLRVVAPQALWSPDEGNAGLIERHAKSLGRGATPAEQMSTFTLVPPFDPRLSAQDNADQQARWRAFCEANLGFVPSAGADERGRWQSYRRARPVHPDILTRREGAAASAVVLDLPTDWTDLGDAAEEWRAFCGLPTQTRMHERWQDFLARRYRKIERLNAAYRTAWPAFPLVALPDRVPATKAAQTDWLQFERHLLPMARTAHTFSVLLPVSSATEDPFAMEQRMQLARRIVELEKPAHTVFDVRFYWALNRIGEARLGVDTLIDVGSRAPQLLPDAVLGRAYVGASFIAGATPPAGGDRRHLVC